MTKQEALDKLIEAQENFLITYGWVKNEKDLWVKLSEPKLSKYPRERWEALEFEGSP